MKQEPVPIFPGIVAVRRSNKRGRDRYPTSIAAVSVDVTASGSSLLPRARPARSIDRRPEARQKPVNNWERLVLKALLWVRAVATSLASQSVQSAISGRGHQKPTEEQENCKHPPKYNRKYGNQYGSGVKCNRCGLRLNWTPGRTTGASRSTGSSSSTPTAASRVKTAATSSATATVVQESTEQNHGAQDMFNQMRANMEVLTSQVQQLTQTVGVTLQQQAQQAQFQQQQAQQAEFQETLANLFPVVQAQAAIAAQQAVAASGAASSGGAAVPSPTSAAGRHEEYDISDIEGEHDWEYPEDQ